MLFVHNASRYFLYQHAANMRKSFYSLATVVREQMQGDALSGDIFIFVSRNQIKLLRWQTDGFAIYNKRLEQGTYELLLGGDEGSFLSVISSSCWYFKASHCTKYSTGSVTCKNYPFVDKLVLL